MASQYDGYDEDRLQVSKPEPVEVDGWPGDLFRYSASDFAVMLRPCDGSFVELRTEGGWTRSESDRVLSDVVQVDARTWQAALPAEIVTRDGWTSGRPGCSPTFRFLRASTPSG